jgi:RND family efflux transporter MFP subunit
MNDMNHDPSQHEQVEDKRSMGEAPPPRADASREQRPKQNHEDDARRGRIARLLALGAVIVVIGMVGVGIWTHVATSNAAKAATQTRADAVPTVHTIVAKADDTPQQVDLPGTMQPFDAATLYARATGYISQRNVDIGSRVHKGDVLAIISAPDQDQQLSQARAQLVQMQASFQQAVAQRGLANVTNKRTSTLVTEGWASRQQGDQDATTYRSQSAGVNVAQANIAAQVAQVNRLAELVGFEKVTAPFDGVITARQIDVGALVTANANSGTPLFSIAKTDVLRVQVYVPQADYFGLKDGQDATISVPQLPGKIFHGRVARNAAALGTTTRTLLAEVDVDNHDGELTAGLYGIVHIQVPRQQPVVSVPTQAIIFNAQGLSVAVIEDGKLAIRHLDVAADDGAVVRVQSGLKEGDRVILNPPVDLKPGMRVKSS